MRRETGSLNTPLRLESRVTLNGETHHPRGAAHHWQRRFRVTQARQSTVPVTGLPGVTRPGTEKPRLSASEPGLRCRLSRLGYLNRSPGHCSRRGSSFSAKCSVVSVAGSRARGDSPAELEAPMRCESHFKSYFGNVKAFDLKKIKINAEPVAAMAAGGPSAGRRRQALEVP